MQGCSSIWTLGVFGSIILLNPFINDSYLCIGNNNPAHGVIQIFNTINCTTNPQVKFITTTVIWHCSTNYNSTITINDYDSNNCRYYIEGESPAACPT